jgi:hypothetical protein
VPGSTAVVRVRDARLACGAWLPASRREKQNIAAIFVITAHAVRLNWVWTDRLIHALIGKIHSHAR